MKIEVNSDGLLNVHLSLHVTNADTIRVLINGEVHPLFVGYATVASALKRVFDEFPKAIINGSAHSTLARIVFNEDERKVRIFNSAEFYTYDELELADDELKREIKIHASAR